MVQLTSNGRIEIAEYVSKFSDQKQNKHKGGIAVAPRAYFLVNLGAHVEQRKFIDLVGQLEEMREVDFVDLVVGQPDMVMVVDAPVTVQATANKLRAREGIEHYYPSERRKTLGVPVASPA